MKKNKKLHFVIKAIKHFGDNEYLDFFINRENLPLVLEFESRGEACTGSRIYLIEEVGKRFGFFAEFNVLLQRLLYADFFHMEPYVVWGKDFLYYDEQMEQFPNAFNYFFETINDQFTNEIEHAELVTKANMGQTAWIQNRYNDGYDLSKEYLDRMAQVYRRYIVLREEVNTKLSSEMTQLLGSKKTIAVHYRGTDYKMNYDNHPVCVALEEQIQVVKEAMENHGFEQIFLATDDREAITQYVKTFGEKVVFYHDVTRSSDKVSVAFSESERSHHHYLLAYEVLRDMLTLSKCEGLIAGVSQVSITARIAKASREEKYSYLHIIDKGKNYNKNKFKEK